MGNIETRDVMNVPEVHKRDLDLSRQVNYEQYCRHVKGDYTEDCILELPWSVIDSVSLYEWLDVSFNWIALIPPEIPLRLPHLNYLNVSHNRIGVLPASMGLLFHLKSLDASYNCIANIPSTLLRLPKLEKMDLSYNALVELPKDIGNAPALRKLNVSHNKLKSLPRSLGSCRTLRVLLAFENFCEDPPQEACEQGSSATLKIIRKFAGSLGSEEESAVRNVFPRIRGNQVQSSVVNPDSARAQYAQMQTQTVNTASRIRTPLLPPSDATTLDASDLRDKITGLIYGAVLGDSLGIATEFLTPDESVFNYDFECLLHSSVVRDEHRSHWQRGDWTATSDLMLILLESLLQWAGVVDELDFAARLKSWSEHGYREIGDGAKEVYISSPVLKEVVNHPSFETDPHSAARQVWQDLTSNCDEASDNGISCDNGCLSQAIILGIPHFHDLSEVESNALRIARTTHSNPACLAVCVATAVISAQLLQAKHNLRNSDEFDALMDEAKNRGMPYIKDEKLRRQFASCFQPQTQSSLQEIVLTNMCSPLTALTVAISTLSSSPDFTQGLGSILMKCGHASVNGCVGGAFLGCKSGYEHLPSRWLAGLRRKPLDWLNMKVNALLDMMGIP